MTLLFIDGFDAQDTVGKWNMVGSSGAVNYTSATRLGYGYAVSLPYSTFNTVYSMEANTPASAQVFVGAAIKTGAALGAYAPFHGLMGDGATTGHLYLLGTDVGSVQLWRGRCRWNSVSAGVYFPDGTLLATSSPGVVSASAWHYVEMSATINSTTGSVVVKVDGVTVLTFTGNTKNGGTNNTIDTVVYSGMNGNQSGIPVPIGSPVVDDLYICNALGSVNNGFLGDIQVQTLSPTGAGSTTGLTPTGSATNYLNVNEVPDSTATYNSSGTVGARDTYALADLAAGTGTILGVQQVVSAAKTGAGAAGLKAAQKSGATVSYGATLSLATGFVTHCDVFEINPATSAAYTVADVNTLEAGAEVA